MKDTKLIRGQLRQIVKEILPELLSTELQKDVTNKVLARVDAIEKFIKAQLKQMETQHKDTLNYLIRSVNPRSKD